jgi:hypothetical protein
MCGPHWFMFSSWYHGFTQAHNAISGSVAVRTGIFFAGRLKIKTPVLDEYRSTAIDRGMRTSSISSNCGTSVKNRRAQTNVAVRKDFWGASSSHSYQHNGYRLFSCSIFLTLLLCVYICVFSLPSTLSFFCPSCHVCSSFYESQIKTQSFMIFWQKVLQQREGGACIGNWGETKGVSEWVSERASEWEGVTIQTLPPNARMRSKGNLCCQLCVFLFGKEQGVERKGKRVGRYPRSFVPILDACASNLHIPLSFSLLPPPPHIAYCLRTNGRPYAKTDHVLDLHALNSSFTHQV